MSETKNRLCKNTVGSDTRLRTLNRNLETKTNLKHYNTTQQFKTKRWSIKGDETQKKKNKILTCKEEENAFSAFVFDQQLDFGLPLFDHQQ